MWALLADACNCLSQMGAQPTGGGTPQRVSLPVVPSGAVHKYDGGVMQESKNGTRHECKDGVIQDCEVWMREHPTSSVLGGFQVSANYVTGLIDATDGSVQCRNQVCKASEAAKTLG